MTKTLIADSNTIEVFVGRLRKLGDIIETVRGFGYRISDAAGG